MIAKIDPIIDHSVRGLCSRPYPGHPKGCPNHAKKQGCPPGAKLFDQVYDLGQPVFVIWNAFPIGEYAARMRELHPEWSERQLYCCLYWQPKARKQLNSLVLEFIHWHPWYAFTGCPEAEGVNVTATMAGIGVTLEWPPRAVAYQVALAGVPREGGDDRDVD